MVKIHSANRLAFGALDRANKLTFPHPKNCDNIEKPCLHAARDRNEEKTPMKRPNLLRWMALLILVFAFPSLACQFSLIDWSLFDPATPVPGSGPTATPTPLVEVTFRVTLPLPLGAGEKLYLAILDEVTGLAFNPLLYEMQPADAQTYTFKLPVPLGSVLKYRYLRQGSVIFQEDTTFGKLVRYRLYHAAGPGEVSDLLASWSDQPYNGPRGRIRGTVTNASNGQPLPNILVSAGGVSTLTDSLGQYVLEGLPPGTHLLGAHALDGTYRPFQQGAAVGADATTPASISLQPAKLVMVTFNLTTPSDTVVGAPVRLAGSLFQLGNTFGELGGGVSTAASRMPTLAPAAQQGRYSLSLRLPAGADIRYKYTLGDGFWNAEHASDGKFVLRQLIVPENDTVVNDTVITWQAGPSAPISFNVTVPANTPVGDTVSIQFNPYGWTEPIPMWPLGNNRWVYRLYSPLNMLGSFGYRYCRNDQCGAADDIETSDPSLSRRVSTSLTPESRQDTVRGWHWLPEASPATVVAVPIRARTAGFWAGVEFYPGYQPSWQALYPSAFINVQGLGANLQVLTPTWTAEYSDPLIFAPTPGQDPLWQDGLQTIQLARAVNLGVALYPAPRLLPSGPDFWLKASRTPGWWEDWFARYRAFALYHADMAAQGGAQALILGGETIAPALPGGLLLNGNPSGVPADAEARWRSLAAEVRSRFKGQLLWAHPYRGLMTAPPAFIDQFDAVYLLWSAPLAGNGQDVGAMRAEAARRLDEEILPVLSRINKPVILALDYPSARGASLGCIPSGGGCLDPAALAPIYPDNTTVVLDLQGQADLYQAMLLAVEERAWVGGFISRGYYPPVSLMDKSSSVRSKPAADLLWYWFPRFLGR
jgi:hypothetical protein